MVLFVVGILTEILIKNGILVTEKKQFKADIKIIDEKIVEIGVNLEAANEISREINADGQFILPGGIDPHVHLSLPDYVPEEFRWCDDFESGSKAALAGGITSLGCISVPDKNELPLGTIDRETKTIQSQAIADIMIHPVIIEPNEDIIAEIPKLMEKGCSTIKIFMVTDDFDKNNLNYLKAIQAAKEAGMLTMIHCEDNPIIKYTCEKMISEGKGSLKYYADSRPVISEVVATQRAVAICELTKAPMYVVHLSSKRALDICIEAQTKSLPFFVEGRPIFLYLTREKYLDQNGPLYVVQPPLREEIDIEALWNGIKFGSINTVATDHAPHTREQKMNPSLNISNLVPGINELQVMLPMLHSKGVISGKIPLERFVELTSTNVAKLFGLYPQKGTIKVGSDADLVLWDTTKEYEIKGSDMFSKAGFSIYEGEKIIGIPKITIRRGEIVYENGKICAETGSGRVLRRKSPHLLS